MRSCVKVKSERRLQLNLLQNGDSDGLLTPRRFSFVLPREQAESLFLLRVLETVVEQNSVSIVLLVERVRPDGALLTLHEFPLVDIAHRASHIAQRSRGLLHLVVVGLVAVVVLSSVLLPH